MGKLGQNASAATHYPLIQVLILPGITDIHPTAQNGKGCAACVQSASVGTAVNPSGQAADYLYSVSGQGFGKLIGLISPVAAAGSGSYNGHTFFPDIRQLSFHVQNARHLIIIPEFCRKFLFQCSITTNLFFSFHIKIPFSYFRYLSSKVR